MLTMLYAMIAEGLLPATATNEVENQPGAQEEERISEIKEWKKSINIKNRNIKEFGLQAL